MMKIQNIVFVLMVIVIIACQDKTLVLEDSVDQNEKQEKKDTNVFVCGNFNLYKRIDDSKKPKNCIAAYLYFKFHSLDFAYNKERNYKFNDKAIIDSIPKILLFKKGPLPFFCLDVTIINSAAPKTYDAINGNLSFKLINKDQVLIYANNFKYYSTSLKDTILISDTILCDLKYNTPG